MEDFSFTVENKSLSWFPMWLLQINTNSDFICDISIALQSKFDSFSAVASHFLMHIDRQVSSQWLFLNDCILLFSLQYPQGLEWQKVHFSPNEHLIRVAQALPPFGRHAVSQQSHGGRGNCHCTSNSCSVTHSLTWQELSCWDSAAFLHPGAELPWPRTSSR